MLCAIITHNAQNTVCVQEIKFLETLSVSFFSKSRLFVSFFDFDLYRPEIHSFNALNFNILHINILGLLPRPHCRLPDEDELFSPDFVDHFLSPELLEEITHQLTVNYFVVARLNRCKVRLRNHHLSHHLLRDA